MLVAFLVCAAGFTVRAQLRSQLTWTITVDGRALAGPTVSFKGANDELVLPISAIARALSDQTTITLQPTARIEVRRRSGIVAEFDAQSGTVRENGIRTLVSSHSSYQIQAGAGENAAEILVGPDIAAALLGASIVVDDHSHIVRISRDQLIPESTSVKTTAASAYRFLGLDYSYNLNFHNSHYTQSLSLRAAGAIGDTFFQLISSSSGGSRRAAFGLQSATLVIEKPKHYRMLLGDFGSGSILEMVRDTGRGLWGTVPLGKDKTLTAFAGKSYEDFTFNYPKGFALQDNLLDQTFDPNKRREFISGAILTWAPNSSRASVSSSKWRGSTGVMNFKGLMRTGFVASSQIHYEGGRGWFQADAGLSSVIQRRGCPSCPEQIGESSETAPSVAIGGLFHAGAGFTFQGKLVRSGSSFYSPNSIGGASPRDLSAGSISWSTREQTLAVNFSAYAAKPVAIAGPAETRFGQDRSASLSLNTSPWSAGPRLSLTHLQGVAVNGSKTSATYVSATQRIRSARLLASLVRTTNSAGTSSSFGLGANLPVKNYGTVQGNLFWGGKGSSWALVSWQSPGLLRNSTSLEAEYNYSRSDSGVGSSLFRAGLSARSFLGHAFTISYLQGHDQKVINLELRRSIKNKRQESFATSAPKTIARTASITGRIYQDNNDNGQYDPVVDNPLSNVRVSVDGTYYVSTNEAGLYDIETVEAGQHKVLLDILSVRADLTLLDDLEKQLKLSPGSIGTVNFRVVRTGQIQGQAWFDENENDIWDTSESGLADVRIFSSSGRDTLTNESGSFVLGDLVPGRYTVGIDEKTLPEGLMFTEANREVVVEAGQTLRGIAFAVRPRHAQIKRFAASN